MNSPQHILKTIFGYDDYRHNQQEIIEHVLMGKMQLCLCQPAGEKVCVTRCLLCLHGVTIVVSPLIALMKDQVDALVVNGIKAAFLNSTLSTHEQSAISQQLKNNHLNYYMCA